jgi:thiamine-monophosphate kinase
VALPESSALRILTEELGDGFSASANGRFLLPLGDDCAVMRPPSGHLAWTTDACVEGHHFLRPWMTPEQLAHKSFHAALSDIPAMGARPHAALCHLGLSGSIDARWLRRFARAQVGLGRNTGCPIVGGNVTSSAVLQIVTTVMGGISGAPIERGSARAGDDIWLIGDVGLARAGLLILQRNLLTPRGSRQSFDVCLKAFRTPEARLKEGPKLLGRATAMMDVSDGLRRDVAKMAKMSGTRFVLDEDCLDSLLRPELIACADVLGESALSLALDGGEDYALLATGPAKRRPSFAKKLGTVEPGTGAFIQRRGERHRLSGGFEHGR